MTKVAAYAAAFFFKGEIMSEPHNDETPSSLEEQLKGMLKNANFSFMMPSGAKPASETGEQEPPLEEEPEENARLKSIREFDLKPRDIKTYLDRFVVRQDEAKKVLSVAICDHYNHVRRCIENPDLEQKEYAKHNIVLLGPTGVGKTYLMRCIARLIGVPFVKADATKFSETGYVGHDVEDLVRDLVKAADEDVDLARYGIIYLDEIDKIASQNASGSKDVSGRGVQINLLKLMEETDVSLFSQTDLIGQMQAIMQMQHGKGPGDRTINTRHMLFIVSGAFDGLSEQVRRRVAASPIGFAGAEAREQADAEFLRMTETRDLIDFGFEPEFVGRLPVRVVCDALAAKDLESILLRAEGNVMEQYRDDLDGYGIQLRFTRDAVAAVAEKACREKTGARGLMTVLEQVLRDFKFELPSTPVRALDISRDAIEDPKQALVKLLAVAETCLEDELRTQFLACAAQLGEEHGLKLQLTEPAIKHLVSLCEQDGCAASEFWNRHFKDLAYGLKLIARNSGQSTFRITGKFAENPEVELSQRIAKSFGPKR